MPTQPRHLSITTRLLATILLVALALVTAHSLFTLGAPTYSYAIEEWVYDFITATAAALTIARAIRRREQRAAWALLGAGLLLWAAGDLYWTAVLRDQAEPPFPSVDDALYLGGYGLILAGLIAYLRPRVGRRNAVLWWDVAVAACCAAAIGSSLLLDYVLAHTSGTVSETAVAVSYPAFDLVMLAVAAGALALTGWRPGRALGLIVAGVACGAVADSVYTYQSLAGTYDASDWNNFLWPLGTLLIAWASQQPPAIHRDTDPAEDWRAYASPAVFALAVVALVVLQRQDLTEPAIAALTIATLVALIARVAVTFWQNHRFVRELQTDSLTGLFNRSKLLHDLDRLFDAETVPPHVLAVLDLDGFKTYNDAFGHPAGDALLVRLSHQLAGAVDGRGRAYRMGGDEFAMLIPGELAGTEATVAAGTAALSERGEAFAVSGSCGVVEIPTEATDRGFALQLADQRMYADKDSRRQSASGEVEAVLVRIVNQRAPELAEHIDAVKNLAIGVGGDLGLSSGELASLGRASELHDIGKIAIPDEILTKQGPLDEDEWRFMRQHTVMGERIVSAAPSLASVGSLIRSSHERWDGQGYPDGLSGAAIPLAARIIAVCDAYDAIASDRPYAEARDIDTTLAEVRRGAGSQFDPRVVDSLERVVKRQSGRILATTASARRSADASADPLTRSSAR